MQGDRIRHRWLLSKSTRIVERLGNAGTFLDAPSSASLRRPTYMAFSSEAGTASREEDDGNIWSQALRWLIAICMIAFGCAATIASRPTRIQVTLPRSVCLQASSGVFILVVRM